MKPDAIADLRRGKLLIGCNPTPIAAGGLTDEPFEDGRKMLAGGKSQIQGNVEDGTIGLIKQFLAMLNPALHVVFDGGYAHLPFKYFLEVRFRGAGNTGKFLNCQLVCQMAFDMGQGPVYPQS